jgi:macrolide-specific efflux system membrane fusion protein
MDLNVRFDDGGVRFPDIPPDSIGSKHRTLLKNFPGTAIAEALQRRLQERGQPDVPGKATMLKVNQATDVWRRISFLRTKSLMSLAAMTLAGAALLVLHSNLRGNAEAESRALGPDAGFAMTRGPFEVAVATSGLIQPFEIVDVGAQVSGQLSALHVKLGDRIEPGQLLGEIDDRVIRARLVQGEAAAENLRAQTNAKQAQLAYARAQQARTDSLSERSIASRAQTELAQSMAAVLAAEVRALEAQLAGQEAALEGIRLDLGYTRIAAPVDGVVTTILAQRGQTLNANQQAPVILRISRDRPLILVARVPETDAERVRAGMPVRFTLVGGPSQTFEGSVGSVMRAPTIINEVVFYDAMIVLDGEQHVLAFGRTVQTFIVLDRLDCAVLVPRRSLPDDAVPGGLIRASIRKQAGTVVTRVLPLRALNEINGAIACDEADKAGIDPPDRVMKIVSERRGES